ncbi:MAG: sensor histidine kinase [Mycobacteriales bacterium]
MSNTAPGVRTRSLRARVRNAITLITVASLLLLGLPLALVLGRLIESQALAGLERDATRGVASVPDNVLEQASVVTPPPSRGDTLIGVYDAQGDLVAGKGPRHSVQAAVVADGREHDGRDGDDLSVVVPVLSDTTVAGSIRAAVPLSLLHQRIYRAWALLAGLALLVFAVAAALARRSAQHISVPFEQLTLAARQLEQGRYDVELPRFGMAEADAAADALRDSAREVEALLRHEREFVRDASHQLRTPLAGALLLLGSNPPDVAGALGRITQLETTLADLLSLRGLMGSGSCDPHDLAAEAVARWNTAARPVTLRADDTEPVGLTGPALRQSLDVLLDNATRHGSGAITVTVEPYGEHVVVEVADHGVGFTPQAQPGTGLQLVTSIVERAGGSLLIRRRAPQARVALLLPLCEPVPIRPSQLGQSNSSR